MVEQLSFRQKSIVFGFGILILCFFLFFGYSIVTSQDKFYHVDITSSINGLKEGSLVTYKGVDVGVVSSIKIVLPEADIVRVTIKVRADLPIRSNYRASLSARGVTGYYTLDLDKTKENADSQELVSGDYIVYKTSAFDSLLENGPEVVKEARNLFMKLNDALTDDEVKRIARNVDGATSNLNNAAKNLLDFSCVAKYKGSKSVDVLLNSLEIIQSIVKNGKSDYSRIQGEVLERLFYSCKVLEVLSRSVAYKMNDKSGVWKFLM